MRADRRALLHDDHRDVGIELLEPDRRREARGTRADDHDVVAIHSRAGSVGSSVIVPFTGEKALSGLSMIVSLGRASAEKVSRTLMSSAK